MKFPKSIGERWWLDSIFVHQTICGWSVYGYTTVFQTVVDRLNTGHPLQFFVNRWNLVINFANPPNFTFLLTFKFLSVVSSVDRVVGFYPTCREFESLTTRQKIQLTDWIMVINFRKPPWFKFLLVSNYGQPLINDYLQTWCITLVGSIPTCARWVLEAQSSFIPFVDFLMVC